MYYNYHKILSYNAPINILIGERRSSEKLIGATKYVIDKFLKKRKKFAYIRRYKSELKKATPKFFTNFINNENYKKVEFNAKNDIFLINKQIAGYSMTLSTAQDLKGSTFSDVETIIFDEFIIEPRSKKILFKRRGFYFFKFN